MIPESETQPAAPRESKLPFVALALLGVMLLVIRIHRVKIGPPARPEPLSQHARPSIAASIFVSFLLLATVIGLFLVVDFAVRRARYLRDSRGPRLSPASLITGFLGYIVLYELVGIAIAGFVGGRSSFAIAAQIALGCFAMLAAVGYGLSLVPRSEDRGLREIGLRRLRVGEALKWGGGGYLAALPLVLGSAYASTWLTGRYGIVTPEHPVVPWLQRGGWTLVAAIVMASVFAPIAEEIAFRGLLFGGLRGVMGFWWAAVTSALVFALVHPTFPGQFVPLAILGVVLAVLRQGSGSLVPCMVCHALNNAISLIAAMLQLQL